MSYLRTLEGVEDSATANDLNDLFDTNDVLGCMIYGPKAWNAIKSFACNRALELLANKTGAASNLKKIFGRKNYVVTNDILDKTFGFNHRLGVELLGAEEWGEFVSDCKLYDPCEEMGGLLSNIGKAVKSVLNPVGTVVPENWSAGGIAQFVLAPGLTNVSDAFAALGSKTQAQKQAEAQAAEAEQARIAAEQYAQQQAVIAAQQVEQAKQAYNTAYAQARAQEDANAAANANLQYQLQTNPEYLQSKTNTVFMICGLAVLAIALWRQ